MIRKLAAATSLLLFITFAGVSINPAHAATSFQVTKTADTADGKCNADCSLREAIIAANANAGADTIKVPAGVYRLTRIGNDDTSAKGDLDVSDDVTLQGAGASKTIIDGNGIDRVISFLSSAPLASLVSGLTIRGGKLHNDGGAALWNYTSLFLENSRITGNTVTGSGSYAVGGGILNNAWLSIYNTTISGNQAYRGGGLFNAGSSTLALQQSTVSGNKAAVGAGGVLFGTSVFQNTTISGNNATGITGGLSVDSSATANLHNVTIANNTPQGLNPSAGATLQNVIIADNGTADCFDAVTTSSGKNMASDNSCALAGTGDQNLTDPMLGPLKNNGGPTMTQALRAGSPAIDIAAPTCTSSDQRGADRSGPCDEGAYEYVACFGSPATRIGTASPDHMKGTPRADVIIGQGGNDVIKGLGGNDRICGGTEDDTLIGGDGRDRLDGGAGTDMCIGGLGASSDIACEGFA